MEITYSASELYSCASLGTQSILAADNTWAGAAESTAEGVCHNGCGAECRDEFLAGIGHGWMLDWEDEMR